MSNDRSKHQRSLLKSVIFIVIIISLLIGQLFLLDSVSASTNTLSNDKQLEKWFISIISILITATAIIFAFTSLKNLRATNLEKIIEEENKKLKELKAKDEAILKSIGDGIIVININGKIILINEPAAMLLNWQPKSVRNKSIFELLELRYESNKKVPLNRNPVNLTLKSNKAVASSRYRFITNNKKTSFSAFINVSPVILNKRNTGAIMVFRDISKEKEIDRMKTEFISLASHQLRTPITAIKWLSEMLLADDAGKLKKDQATYVDSIWKSSERMNQIIDGLLKISRIESGHIVMDPIPTDIKALINEILEELKPRIENKKLKLFFKIPDEFPKVTIDKSLIVQAYLNLLSNAIKYTQPKGKISITIKKFKNEMISEISDNGLGIAKSEHSKVFEKFFRGKNIQSLDTDGTGLGLYLVKLIVEASDGKIWFESKEGKGSTFTFALPLKVKKQVKTKKKAKK